MTDGVDGEQGNACNDKILVRFRRSGIIRDCNDVPCFPCLLASLRLQEPSLRKNRFLILLIIQLLMIVVYPFLEGFSFHRIVLDGLILLIFFSALYAISDRKKSFYLVVCLVVLDVPVKVAVYLLPSFGNTCEILDNGLSIVLLTVTAVIILGYVLKEGRVTHERIYAALCVYLLMGAIFADIFLMIEDLDPHAFNTSSSEYEQFSQESNQLYRARRRLLTYFSYITLTTVGYGDVTPRSAPARAFALLEGILGPLYLAVLIARLVGLYTAHAAIGPEDEKDE